MDKTVCELFAGVGGFRCGLNQIKSLEDMKKEESWKTVWFNQWEPLEKKTQYAHGCYVYHFGTCLDINGNDTTNMNIEEIAKAGDQFDPNFHEAVMHIEDETLGENVIAEVLQKGYKIGDTVIRAAMVKVANRHRRCHPERRRNAGVEGSSRLSSAQQPFGAKIPPLGFAPVGMTIGRIGNPPYC